MDLVEMLRTRAMQLLDRLQWIAPLIGRFAVGMLFLSTGWGKVHHLDKITSWFQELGIPAPAFQATLVSYSELICGTLLVVGLLTRLATVPLIVSMIVAILTAKLKDLHNIFDLVGFDEFTYFAVLVMLAFIGPGLVSLDHLVARKLGWSGQPKAKAS
jgi:putative oxidoreductase